MSKFLYCISPWTFQIKLILENLHISSPRLTSSVCFFFDWVSTTLWLSNWYWLRRLSSLRLINTKAIAALHCANWSQSYKIILLSISSTLCIWIFCTNVVSAAFFTYTLLEKKLRKQHSYEKCVRITLMKLSPSLKKV